jgi:hypothetical protein
MCCLAGRLCDFFAEAFIVHRASQCDPTGKKCKERRRLFAASLGLPIEVISDGLDDRPQLDFIGYGPWRPRSRWRQDFARSLVNLDVQLNNQGDIPCQFPFK